MKSKIYTYLWIICCSFLLILFMSCKKENAAFQDGDLLFIEADSKPISSAINEVTQTNKKTSFDHVAIVKIYKGSPFVLEASSKYGTRRIALADFLDEQNTAVHLYRLHPEYTKYMMFIWHNAENLLNKPYNFSYIRNDSSYYCSDFIYTLFEQDKAFELNPMTFKDPNTNEFNVNWINYYDNLGLEIPEGQLGCNPNGMAASPNLTFIRIVK